MPSKAKRFLAIVLFAPAVFGQIFQERAYYFKATDSARDQQEIATVIRETGDLKDVSADSAQNTLTVRGTDSQLALANWLFTELDTNPASSQKEYRVSLTSDDVVHMFYVANAPTVREFQELATAVRNTTDIRRLFTYSASRAVVVRGTPDQIKLAGWLYQQMDQPPFSAGERQAFVATESPGPRGESSVKVFYLTNTIDARSFQELATLVRSTGLIRQASTYSKPRAMVVRGTAEQTALAEWLVNELDKPVAEAHKHQEYKVSAKADDLVRVFYFPQGDTIANFQQCVEAVRKATGVHKAYTYGGPRALVLRGTQNEIAWADQLIQAQAK
jgi:hypothetical protein